SCCLQRESSLQGSHQRAVRKVSFSPCDRYLASAGFDSCIVVYKLNSGDYEEVNKLEGQESEIKCCEFSPSAEYLASCSRDKTVWFWQMDEEEDLTVASILQPHTQDVKFVKWHPYEECLVSCSYDCSIVFYRLDGDEWIVQQRIENAHDSTVWCCDFSDDGKALATVGADGIIKIWSNCWNGTSVATSKWEKVIEHQVTKRWPLYTVSWSKISGLLAVGGGDSFLRIFRVLSSKGAETFEELYSVKWRRADINCLHWNPKKPDYLAVGSDDGLVQVLCMGV
ncbi:unnamed protein product, partial [Enterobius vermicularis]|uniref:WD_REPEATS_REGION domain-containing protein n=1 Tax=Enterobius vermicularis TaxID=51028 RepID=A0A0N4VD60_ENTVE